MAETTTAATMSISITRDLLDRLKKALPRYGDRSHVLRLLIKGFLDGRFIVTSKQ